MKAYSECIRINPDDKIIKNRLILLHRVYDTSEPASSASRVDRGQTDSAGLVRP
jgi:hypothetical protein